MALIQKLTFSSGNVCMRNARWLVQTEKVFGTFNIACWSSEYSIFAFAKLIMLRITCSVKQQRYILYGITLFLCIYQVLVVAVEQNVWSANHYPTLDPAVRFLLEEVHVAFLRNYHADSFLRHLADYMFITKCLVSVFRH